MIVDKIFHFPNFELTFVKTFLKLFVTIHIWEMLVKVVIKKFRKLKDKLQQQSQSNSTNIYVLPSQIKILSLLNDVFSEYKIGSFNEALQHKKLHCIV